MRPSGRRNYGDDVDESVTVSIAQKCSRKEEEAHHVGNNVVVARSNEEEDGQVGGKDLGHDVLGKAGHEDGGNDCVVTADSAQEDLVERRLGFHVGCHCCALADCWGVDATIVDDDAAVVKDVSMKMDPAGDMEVQDSRIEECTREVTNKDKSPVDEPGPEGHLSLHRRHDHDGHLTSHEIGLEEDDHDETEGEDEALKDLEEARG